MYLAMSRGSECYFSQAYYLASDVDDDAIMTQSGKVREWTVVASFKALSPYPREENEAGEKRFKMISCIELRIGGRLSVYSVLTRVSIVAPTPYT
jgi:hypothetical protein